MDRCDLCLGGGRGWGDPCLGVAGGEGRVLRAPRKNSALNQSRKCEVVRPHFWGHKKHQKLRTRRCTSTVLHGMAGAVGANVAGHLLGVGGNHKLNLAGRSCTCELNLVSKILCFTTLKTSIYFDPKNGVTDTPFNGSIIETCES